MNSLSKTFWCRKLQAQTVSPETGKWVWDGIKESGGKPNLGPGSPRAHLGERNAIKDLRKKKRQYYKTLERTEAQKLTTTPHHKKTTTKTNKKKVIAQYPSRTDSPQLGVILAHRGHVAMSRDAFGYRDLRGRGGQHRAEAACHPTRHRTAHAAICPAQRPAAQKLRSRNTDTKVLNRRSANGIHRYRNRIGSPWWVEFTPGTVLGGKKCAPHPLPPTIHKK